ncbi:SEC-C metal-binding domain-containing protein, partial [Rhodopirellula baltica]
SFAARGSTQERVMTTRMKQADQLNKLPEMESNTAAQRAAAGSEGRAEGSVDTVRVEEPRIGRNAPCPCGSGKKYKSCCMRRDG